LTGLNVRAIVHHIIRPLATEVGAAKRHWKKTDWNTEILPHSSAIGGRQITENMVVFIIFWG
jgi:hypothetical protein